MWSNFNMKEAGKFRGSKLKAYDLKSLGFHLSVCKPSRCLCATQTDGKMYVFSPHKQPLVLRGKMIHYINNVGARTVGIIHPKLKPFSVGL